MHAHMHSKSCAIRCRAAWVINKVQMATVKIRNMSFLESGTKKQANYIHVVVSIKTAVLLL